MSVLRSRRGHIFESGSRRIRAQVSALQIESSALRDAQLLVHLLLTMHTASMQLRAGDVRRWLFGRLVASVVLSPAVSLEHRWDSFVVPGHGLAAQSLVSGERLPVGYLVKALQMGCPEGVTRLADVTGRRRGRDVIRCALENLRDLPIRLRMAIKGSRYDAHPFDLLSSHCPLCVGSYEGHEFSIVGSALPPWESFVSAVQNANWESAVELGRSDELIGQIDLALAAALLCERTGKMAVLLYRSPGTLAGSHTLISQQVLNERMSEQLRPYLSVWRPVMQDRLQSIRDMRARVRELRRASQSRP